MTVELLKYSSDSNTEWLERIFTRSEGIGTVPEDCKEKRDRDE